MADTTIPQIMTPDDFQIWTRAELARIDQLHADADRKRQEMQCAMMRLCRDCRHVEDDGVPRCAHPKVAFRTTSFYDGTEHDVRPTIDEARMLSACDVDGKLWEPITRGFE